MAPQETPFDPREAENMKKAVFIGQQTTGDTIIIGQEEKEEWITTNNMRPLTIEEYR
jgi:hypothetical protein